MLAIFQPGTNHSLSFVFWSRSSSRLDVLPSPKNYLGKYVLCPTTIGRLRFLRMRKLKRLVRGAMRINVWVRMLFGKVFDWRRRWFRYSGWKGLVRRLMCTRRVLCVRISLRSRSCRSGGERTSEKLPSRRIYDLAYNETISIPSKFPAFRPRNSECRSLMFHWTLQLRAFLEELE